MARESGQHIRSRRGPPGGVRDLSPAVRGRMPRGPRGRASPLSRDPRPARPQGRSGLTTPGRARGGGGGGGRGSASRYRDRDGVSPTARDPPLPKTRNPPIRYSREHLPGSPPRYDDGGRDRSVRSDRPLMDRQRGSSPDRHGDGRRLGRDHDGLVRQGTPERERGGGRRGSSPAAAAAEDPLDRPSRKRGRSNAERGGWGLECCVTL